MKKVILLSILAVTLSGCSSSDWGAKFIGNTFETCEGGVLYLQFASGVSVAYNVDGSIKTCKGK